jgi:hypothetical protein
VLFLFYVVSYCSYLIVGGYIMSILETSNEEDLKATTRLIKENFLLKNPSINSKDTYVKHPQLECPTRALKT